MKTIGIIGGMSWESTVTYYQIINETVKRELGGFHSAKILLYSVDFDEIEKYQELGLDGVEVWSPYNSEEDVQTLTDLCKKLKLLMTGGSDFHGSYGEKIVTLGSYSTPKDNLDKLLGYKAKKKRAQRKAEKEAAKKDE